MTNETSSTSVLGQAVASSTELEPFPVLEIRQGMKLENELYRDIRAVQEPGSAGRRSFAIILTREANFYACWKLVLPNPDNCGDGIRATLLWICASRDLALTRAVLNPFGPVKQE